MTAKNSILLIIKQNNGIDYNTLVNKIRSNYSSINSARAALSRALKDLNAFGLVRRQNNNLFITDKGASQINSEMKSKLLLKLNQLINAKQNHKEVDAIIPALHALIERSKNDSDLLKAARGSTDFYISDLEKMNSRIEKQIKHLNYISRVLAEQTLNLKELGFDDIKELEFSEKSIKKIEKLAKKMDVDELIVESNNNEFLTELSKKLDASFEKESIKIPIKKLKELHDFLNSPENLLKSIKLTTFISNLKLAISPGKLYLIGEAKTLEENL